MYETFTKAPLTNAFHVARKATSSSLLMLALKNIITSPPKLLRTKSPSDLSWGFCPSGSGGMRDEG